MTALLNKVCLSKTLLEVSVQYAPTMFKLPCLRKQKEAQIYNDKFDFDLQTVEVFFDLKKPPLSRAKVDLAKKERCPVSHYNYF